jgi:hypothetical protein
MNLPAPFFYLYPWGFSFLSIATLKIFARMYLSARGERITTIFTGYVPFFVWSLAVYERGAGLVKGKADDRLHSGGSLNARRGSLDMLLTQLDMHLAVLDMLLRNSICPLTRA